MGLVYFLGDGISGFVKIGATSKNEIDGRIGSMQTGNPNRLKVLKKIETSDPFGLENLLHRKFESKRRPGEWFELPEADVDEAERLARFFAESIPVQERVEKLKIERDNGILIEPLQQHQELVERLREVKYEYGRLKLEKEQLELELKALIGLSAGIYGLATWKAYDTHYFDRQQLEIERPDIFTEYWKTRVNRKLLLMR